MKTTRREEKAEVKTGVWSELFFTPSLRTEQRAILAMKRREENEHGENFSFTITFCDPFPTYAEAWGAVGE